MRLIDADKLKKLMRYMDTESDAVRFNQLIDRADTVDAVPVGDRVNHPAHYALPGLGVESIDVVKAVLGSEGFKKFCRGNALKYLIRADKKGGAEDLQKAMVYINWELSGLNAEAPESEEEAEETEEPEKELEDVKASALWKVSLIEVMSRRGDR